MKKNSSGGGSQTQTIAPPEYAQPYLEEFTRAASTAFGSTDRTPFEGQLVARLRPEEVAAQQGALNFANSLAGIGLPTINQGLLTQTGAYAQAETNPYLQSAISAAIRPVGETLVEQVLPGIVNQSIQQGAYGGNREGLAQGRAVQGFVNESLDMAGRLAAANYGAERDRMMRAPEMIAQGINLETLPIQLYGGVGGARRQAEQQLLDERSSLINEQHTAPWRGFDQYAAALSLSSPYATRSTQTPSGGIGGAVQGGLGGAMLGGTFASELLGLSGIGPIAPYAGGAAVLGALAGLL